MNQFTYYLVSLGCAKNTVDSSGMAQLMAREGYLPAEELEQAEVVLVNTCGFIQSARDESIQVLSELAQEKKPGQLLVAAGCLSQRFGKELLQQVQGIDGLLGTRRWMDILRLLQTLRDGRQSEPRYHLPDAPVVGRTPEGISSSAVQGVSAYLKIADGCRRPCAFCAIPLIKGTAVSRPLDELVQEARALEASGVRELNLIAQDTTDYGSDLGMKDGLAALLERISQDAPGIDWLRVLYAYPGYITDSLIDLMADTPQILPYIDLPLQHADPDLLKKMRRPASLEWIYQTVEKLRRKMPRLALRTTFIVGYPGETEAAFQNLLDFIDQIRFDRVGCFIYSFEPGTTAEQFGNPIPEQVKLERQEQLMLRQQEISLQINQQFVGRTLDVLIEGQGQVDGTDEVISLGRSYRDAPEIDGLVLVEGKLPEGKILPVQITGAMTYDLSAIPVPPGRD